jgi:tetratricopeptide (TPR) repeat protein
MKPLVWLALILVIVALVLSAPALFAQASKNYGLVSALKAPACDAEWFVCQNLPDQYPPIQFAGNQAVLMKAQSYFELAARSQPNSESLRLHLAEIAFALGDRQKAAQYLDDIKYSDPSRSPLLQEQRYEAHLIKARQEVARGNFEAAVYDFRLGLAWGDERTLPADERDYFLALAELEKRRLSNNPTDTQAAYRVGRYLIQAGEWETGLGYFDHSDVIAGLSDRQAAWIYSLYGQYSGDHGQATKAIDDYSQALKTNPEFRPAAIRLLGLLRHTGRNTAAVQVEEDLQALGPSYHLGARGENYQASKPAALSDTWTLVGYDLDDELLEQAKSLELFLWWQSPEEQPQGEGWTKVGDYWVQRQVVTNVFPNAGFEWGMDERGIPLGHAKELYNSPPGSLNVIIKERAGEQTNIAAANNSAAVRHIALISRKMPVDESSYYLMAGQIWDEGGSATIGRSCSSPQPDSPSPYYIIGYQGQPLSAWIAYSELSTPFPGYRSKTCETLLMNDANSDRPAYWDNILWTRIQNP